MPIKSAKKYIDSKYIMVPNLKNILPYPDDAMLYYNFQITIPNEYVILLFYIPNYFIAMSKCVSRDTFPLWFVIFDEMKIFKAWKMRYLSQNRPTVDIWRTVRDS